MSEYLEPVAFNRKPLQKTSDYDTREPDVQKC